MKTYNIINPILDEYNSLYSPLTLIARVTTYGNSVISIQSITLNSSDIGVTLIDFTYEYRILQDVTGLSQNDIETIAYINFRQYLDSFFGQENVSEA